MKLFVIENMEIVINQEEVLLVPEFAALWKLERNKCDGDKSGRKRLRAFKEFAFIFLMYDWTSPYEGWAESERKEAILEEYKFTKKELEDPEFRFACDKYLKMQTSIKLELLKSAKKAVNELIIFFNNYDATKLTGDESRYLYSPKDVMKNLQDLGKTVEGLDTLVEMVKKEKEAESSLRGGAKKGVFD